MILNMLIANAYKVLDGEALTRAEALALAEQIGQEDLLDLLALANKVRKKFAGAIEPCSIINAKSGRCSQNCRFCAQSGHHDTGIESYELLAPEDVLAAARAVYEAGVRTFGYVTSGCGYLEPNEEFHRILATLDLLHETFPDLKLCVSIDTHSIEDKIATIRALQKHGVTNCTGGILGLGETWADRVDLAFAIRELDVEGIPLNVLLPIQGTPLADQPVLTPAETAKAFALFRLINPTKMIKFAAGRETTMKDFQGLLMLAGANSMITGGYLTTRGRSIDDDQAFIRQLNDF